MGTRFPVPVVQASERAHARKRSTARRCMLKTRTPVTFASRQRRRHYVSTMRDSASWSGRVHARRQARSSIASMVGPRAFTRPAASAARGTQRERTRVGASANARRMGACTIIIIVHPSVGARSDGMGDLAHRAWHWATVGMALGHYGHGTGRAPTVWAIWHIEHGWQKQLRQTSPARLPSIPYLLASQSPIPLPTRPPPSLPPAHSRAPPASGFRARSAGVDAHFSRTDLRM
jgi:hypothetical protein